MSNNKEITHIGYVFKKTGVHKRMVFGTWDKGGIGRLESNGDFTLLVDMLPRCGWDGRVRFVKIGNPTPNDGEPDAYGKEGNDPPENYKDPVEGSPATED
jgi:hypothetical protein